MPFVEAGNQPILDTNQVPFRVSQGDIVTRISGQPAPPVGPDGVNFNSDRVYLDINGPRVVQILIDNVFADAQTDVQLNGTVTCFYTHSPRELVEADIAVAKAGGTVWNCLWTDIAPVGTPDKIGTVHGNITGLRFAGAGAVVISKL